MDTQIEAPEDGGEAAAASSQCDMGSDTIFRGI